MSAPATSTPEQVVAELMRALDAQDYDAMEGMLASEPQGIDEIARRWLRGGSALHDYFAMLREAAISDLHSELSDSHATEWGDTALVTSMLDQSYTLGGESRSVHSPTTIVLRREGGSWKVVLVHSVPLPEDA